MLRFPRIWTKLEGNSSYKLPGASYTAQGPQKQSETFKHILFMFRMKNNQSMCEKCLGPFLTIFGDMKSINPLYFLTGFLTLFPPGKRETEGKKLKTKKSNVSKQFHLKCIDQLHKPSSYRGGRSFWTFLHNFKRSGRGSGRGGSPSPSCRGGSGGRRSPPRRIGTKPNFLNPSFSYPSFSNSPVVQS